MSERSLRSLKMMKKLLFGSQLTPACSNLVPKHRKKCNKLSKVSETRSRGSCEGNPLRESRRDRRRAKSVYPRAFTYCDGH